MHALTDNNVHGALNTIEVNQFVCGPEGVGDASSSWDKIFVTEIP